MSSLDSADGDTAADAAAAALRRLPAVAGTQRAGRRIRRRAGRGGGVRRCTASRIGIPASRRALLVDASTLLSGGLLAALISGLPAIVLGQPFMTAWWGSIGVGRFQIAVGTPLLFDIGVFLAVIGVVLTIVVTLADSVLAEN